MRVALLAKVRRGRDQSGADLQLRTLRAFADDRGWLVTREYADMADGEFPGRGAKKMIVDASVNWFDAVLVASLEGYGGLKSASVRVVVDQLAAHRVWLVCAHQEGGDSSLRAKVVLRIESKVVERGLSILDRPWSERASSRVRRWF
jgi:DNA invertase Pin-like site-specific DNA recombinase